MSQEENLIRELGNQEPVLVTNEELLKIRNWKSKKTIVWDIAWRLAAFGGLGMHTAYLNYFLKPSTGYLIWGISSTFLFLSGVFVFRRLWKKSWNMDYAKRCEMIDRVESQEIQKERRQNWSNMSCS